eukprot:1478767-Lingulodinium_polyedra.AAC.1
MKIAVFAIGLEGAKAAVEFRLLQRYIYQETEQKNLITRQHQQWDRWIEQGKVYSIPEAHWRKGRPTGQGGSSSTLEPSRCLGNAAISGWAVLHLVAMWSAGA